MNNYGNTNMSGKAIIFSAPSGSGKTTIVRHLLEVFEGRFGFSVSATSRPPRGNERDGVDYYFINPEEFRLRIAGDEFVEYEEVYRDKFYGTLKSEVYRLWADGKVIVFDVDVKGGINLKRYFGDDALSIFIQAPSIDVLRQRLQARGTDSPATIEERVAKAAEEMSFAPEFDHILVNDDLEICFKEAETLVGRFIGA